MSLLGGRGGRTDDWSTPHLRAQARAAERLDGPLEPAEEAWLDEHLADCHACATAAADYASHRLELRTLRNRPPLPPRDLWARTAAAIEREARHHSRRGRRSARSLLAPYALLASALIVAVAVGSLSLSRFSGPAPTAAATVSFVSASGRPIEAASTPIPVNPGSVAYLTQANGRLQLNHLEFTHVCGPTTKGCESSPPADTQTIGPVASPDTVFGAAAGDRPLVVVSGGSGSGGKIYAVALTQQQPTVTPTPSSSSSTTAPPATAATTPTPTPTATASEAPIHTPTPSAPPPPPASIPASASPSEPATAEPSGEPSPLPSGSPAAVVEIARDLQVLDTTAAYAPDGSAFAFTARPSDGSHGPDIYLWRVGDPEAVPITTDHRSVFGSWAGGSIIGSTMTAGPDGQFNRPRAFVLLTGATEPTLVPQAGCVWRPVVDPTGRSAVYWAGRLEATDDGLGWTTENGRLVVGRWDDVTAITLPSASSSPDTIAEPSASSSPDTIAEPSASSSPDPIAEPSASSSPDPIAEPSASSSLEPTATPSPCSGPDAAASPSASSSPDPTAASPSVSSNTDPTADPSASSSPQAMATGPADADQPLARSETTIAAGPLAEWDARWDETGTRLAVWIADPNDPTVGRLSLYVVDPFDGRIDHSKPPLVDEPALAGFAIADGHLAWAAPPTGGSPESSVLVLAWTPDEFGKVESAPGDVILVR